MATNNATNTANPTGVTPGSYTLTNLTVNAAGLITAATNGSAGSGTAITKSIHQVAHGFSVQQLLYLNSTTYTLAQANSVAAAEVIGIVTTVTDADNFIITTSGYCSGLSGLTADHVYWLSDGTPGLLTATQPSTIGNIQKPVLVADTTTSGYFINYRGEVIPSPSVVPIWSAISSNTNLAINSAYYITGGGALVLTLPVTSAAGSVIWIQGSASTSWSIAVNTGQNIWVGNVQSTTTTGTVTSTNAHDGIYLVCTVANTTWQSTQLQGFLTVT